MIPSILNLIGNVNEENDLFAEENNYYENLYGAIEEMLKRKFETIRDNGSCAI